MANLITKLNKLMLDGSPMEELIDACAGIDIESCFEPILNRRLIFWKNAGNAGKTR